MIEPQRMTCDLCKNPIAEGAVHAVLSVPIPPKIREQLLRYAEAHVAPRFANSPIGSLLTVDALVPRTWKLEMCTGCTFGLFQGLYGVIETQVQDGIDRHLARARLEMTSLEDLEQEN